jgi:hypothetical protein
MSLQQAVQVSRTRTQHPSPQKSETGNCNKNIQHELNDHKPRNASASSCNSELETNEHILHTPQTTIKKRQMNLKKQS